MYISCMFSFRWLQITSARHNSLVDVFVCWRANLESFSVSFTHYRNEFLRHNNIFSVSFFLSLSLRMNHFASGMIIEYVVSPGFMWTHLLFFFSFKMIIIIFFFLFKCDNFSIVKWRPISRGRWNNDTLIFLRMWVGDGTIILSNLQANLKHIKHAHIWKVTVLQLNCWIADLIWNVAHVSRELEFVSPKLTKNWMYMIHEKSITLTSLACCGYWNADFYWCCHKF